MLLLLRCTEPCGGCVGGCLAARTMQSKLLANNTICNRGGGREGGLTSSADQLGCTDVPGLYSKLVRNTST